VRAIIQGWEESVSQLSLPPAVHAAGPLPHSWLLPGCAAVADHGGFGATAAGLRAGIPALVVPHIADQFCWAKIVHELGVGPQPIRRARLSTDGLARSLDERMHNDKLRQPVSSLVEQIGAEHGIDNAVRLIEEEFS
jgi:sterol 3beta-glucosyltransferase